MNTGITVGQERFAWLRSRAILCILYISFHSDTAVGQGRVAWLSCKVMVQTNSTWSEAERIKGEGSTRLS